MRQLQQDVRLWNSGEEKAPEGFGKFYPGKNGSKGSSSSSGSGNKAPKGGSGSQQGQQPKERGQQIEFKFSFGKGGGSGGSGGKGPIDANMWTMFGFVGTIAALMGFTMFKMR